MLLCPHPVFLWPGDAHPHCANEETSKTQALGRMYNMRMKQDYAKCWAQGWGLPALGFLLLLEIQTPRIQSNLKILHLWGKFFSPSWT